MKKKICSLLLICMVQVMTGCATAKPDAMDVVMAPITLPADLMMAALMIPSIPFAIAYDASMAEERAAYNTRNKVNYTQYSKHSQPPKRGSVKAGDRVWREY